MAYIVEAVVIAVLVVMLILSRRTRGRAAEVDAHLRRDLVAGSHVMTTSGLYGTVVALNSDDTVIVAIAPGVEVRWAFAALRDAATARRARFVEDGKIGAVHERTPPGEGRAAAGLPMNP